MDLSVPRHSRKGEMNDEIKVEFSFKKTKALKNELLFTLFNFHSPVQLSIINYLWIFQNQVFFNFQQVTFTLSTFDAEIS